MRRRCLTLAVTLTALVVAAAWWASSDEWMMDDFQRIQVGMTRAEVERILGPPSLARPMRGWVHDGTISVRLGEGVGPPHKDERDYDYAGWQRVGRFRSHSAVVIFDGDRAACRYGQVFSDGICSRWWNRIRSVF